MKLTTRKALYLKAEFETCPGDSLGRHCPRGGVLGFLSVSVPSQPLCSALCSLYLLWRPSPGRGSPAQLFFSAPLHPLIPVLSAYIQWRGDIPSIRGRPYSRWYCPAIAPPPVPSTSPRSLICDRPALSYPVESERRVTEDSGIREA